MEQFKDVWSAAEQIIEWKTFDKAGMSELPGAPCILDLIQFVVKVFFAQILNPKHGLIQDHCLTQMTMRIITEA